MIEICGLSKSYGKHKVLDNITLTFNKGQIIALLGPNGAGKTTLINCLLGLLAFDEGKITMFDGIQPGQLSARKKIGVIPQENSFYPSLTVRENAYFIAKLYGMSDTSFEIMFKNLLKNLRFDDSENEIAENLSGGMKKRMMLIMALVHDPELIILDEPTAGVDPRLRREFWSFFKELTKQGKTILITTHHIAEAKDADEIIFMRNGYVFEKASPNELLIKYNTNDLEEAYLMGSEA